MCYKCEINKIIIYIFKLYEHAEGDDSLIKLKNLANSDPLDLFNETLLEVVNKTIEWVCSEYPKNNSIKIITGSYLSTIIKIYSDAKGIDYFTKHREILQFDSFKALENNMKTIFAEIIKDISDDSHSAMQQQPSSFA